MTTPPVGVERRIGQRFPLTSQSRLRDVLDRDRRTWIHPGSQLARSVSVHRHGAQRRRGDRTHVKNALRDHSGRKYAGSLPGPGSAHHQARGQGLESRRLTTESKSAETKIGVAVCLKGYEYLPETEDGSADFRRISALHSPGETERTVAHRVLAFRVTLPARFRPSSGARRASIA
jgi:hypothetical protein